MAMLAMLASVALGTVAWGQEYGRYDNDDYYNRHDEAREHGYRNGYRDGIRAGQYDSERGRRFHFKNDDWEDSRGYEHWMGSKGRYKHEYREGYERGYRQAYDNYGDRRGWDRDRDDSRRHDRDDWR
jgi:nitrogen fixation-related uncharacterized protein